MSSGMSYSHPSVYSMFALSTEMSVVMLKLRKYNYIISIYTYLFGQIFFFSLHLILMGNNEVIHILLNQ